MGSCVSQEEFGNYVRAKHISYSKLSERIDKLEKEIYNINSNKYGRVSVR